MRFKVDVAVCTYQSEKYLDQCLMSIKKNVPFHKLIVVDHYSTDRTIEIAKKHNVEIYFENVSLGYARQIAIEHSNAPFILFVDSDVVFYDDEWFRASVMLFNDEQRKVGAIGVEVPARLPPWRQKYVDFWWKTIPQIRRPSFSNVYFLRRKAIEGIKIPNQLELMNKSSSENMLNEKDGRYMLFKRKVCITMIIPIGKALG